MPDSPRPLVVDASVVVKWFVSAGESGTDTAAELLTEHADGAVRLVAPTLLAQEVFGVLTRGGRTAGSADEAIEAFCDVGVVLIAPTRELMLTAADLMRSHGVSALDSAYAGLAKTLDCELATADRKLARAVSGAVRVRRA
ncbi:MAG: type II toxin-antitoxin system VapC family toxin [Coriobacteriia bacterium]|nr:type II toxin-antitoxin system VapC family toxin [Coriobacteriia bacterium]